MYFGRRNKKSSVSERAERASANEAQIAPVASDERAALMASDPEDQANDNIEGTPEPVSTASSPPTFETDPTQPLLTALGRFHREVTRAKDAPTDGWADSCMQNLITAVDIAVEHDWSDMVDTLTETARVLQTYDQANKATDAIPFLDESYEILCLMVGNILVGVTRSDAGERWQTCHRKALEDLTSAGLTLVRDREEVAASEPKAEVEIEDAVEEVEVVDESVEAEAEVESYSDEDTTHEEIEEDAFASDVIEAPVDIADEIEAPEEETIEESVEITIDDPTEEPTEEVEDVIEDVAPPVESKDEGAAQALDSFCTALSGLEGGSEDADEMFGAMKDGINFLEQHGEERGYTASVGAARTMKRLCAEAQAAGPPCDEKFIEMAFAFCEAYMDGQSDSAESTMSWTLEAEAMLVGAEAVAPPAVEEPPAAEESPVEPVADEADSPFESPALDTDSEVSSPIDEGTDAFDSDSELDSEAPDIVLHDEPAIEESVEEEIAVEAPTEDFESDISPQPMEEIPAVEDSIDKDMSPESDTMEEESSVNVLPEEEDDGSAMRLLAIAQQAASTGNIAEAKLLALRAATRIADDEAKKSAADLIDAERRLNEGAEAVAAAKNSVSEAEAAVANAETAVTEAQGKLDSERGETARIGDVIEELENGVAALEAQIAELIAQKEEEESKLAHERNQHAEAEQRVGESESALEARREAETEARRTLEDARQQVKSNQERRTDVEREREEIQQRLLQQRNNVAELEETILKTEGKSGKAADNSDEENLLFEDM